MKEKIYITRRKVIALFNRIVFYLCRVFPIDSNYISVCTFEGKGGFGCNPKYIVQEIHKMAPDVKIIWFVNEESWEKSFPDYIKKVKNTLWNRAFWLSKSKVWIDNYRKPYGTCKRRKQFYINTWHGMIGFKTIGLWRGNAFSQMAYLVSKNDSEMVDVFLSDSKYCSSFFVKGLVHSGPFFECGSPRCDILLKDRSSVREEFRRQHGLNLNTKCIMFAPTFREKINDGKREVFSENWSIDFIRMIKNLEERFGGEWCLVIRLHPQLANIKISVDNTKVVDVSKDDDMYFSLAAMDAFITDYSSGAMDAALMHVPVFVYADDISEYKDFRGEFIWDIAGDTRGYNNLNSSILPEFSAQLPFSIAKNNDELENDILLHDEEKYEKLLEKYESDMGIVVEGNASENVAKMILEKLRNGE